MLKPGFHKYWWGFYLALDNKQTNKLIDAWVSFSVWDQAKS